MLFFVLVAALFPFGVGPAPETLARLAPGALLAAALLAALLPLDRLFGADAEDGTLDQLLLSGLGGIVGVLIGIGATAGYALTKHWPGVFPPAALVAGVGAAVFAQAQQAEVVTMEQMLRARGAQPLG